MPRNKVANNVGLRNGRRQGWFVAGSGRSANRPEALAILRLFAVVSGRKEGVPAPIASPRFSAE
jgi:hypothetical protein